MSLHPPAQPGQLALALGLGAALGLLFDVLRVPRRHARRAFTRAVLDTALCMRVGLVVVVFGMAAGPGPARLGGGVCSGLRRPAALGAGAPGCFACPGRRTSPRG